MILKDVVITTTPESTIFVDDKLDTIKNVMMKERTIWWSERDDGKNTVFHDVVRGVAVLFRGASEFCYGISFGYPICCVWAFTTHKSTISMGKGYAVCEKCANKIKSEPLK